MCVAAIAACGSCTQEARPFGGAVPLSPPTSASDPRIPYFQNNVYQVGQGGRYFSWYGCSGCHSPDATGARDLGDGRWAHGGGFDQVYRSIAQGHGTLGQRIPTQQLWQITAFVRDLPQEDPARRRRQSADEAGEAIGGNWTGPVP